jgi:hypothetical protein
MEEMGMIIRRHYRVMLKLPMDEDLMTLLIVQKCMEMWPLAILQRQLELTDITITLDLNLNVLLIKISIIKLKYLLIDRDNGNNKKLPINGKLFIIFYHCF